MFSKICALVNELRPFVGLKNSRSGESMIIGVNVNEACRLSIMSSIKR